MHGILASFLIGCLALGTGGAGEVVGTFVPVKDQRPPKVHLGVECAVQSSTFRSNDPRYVYKTVGVSNPFNPRTGLRAGPIVLFAGDNGVTFRTGLLYDSHGSSFRRTGMSHLPDSLVAWESEGSIRVEDVTCPLLLGYAPPGPGWVPFLEAGLQLGYRLETTSAWTRTIRDVGDTGPPISVTRSRARTTNEHGILDSAFRVGMGVQFPGKSKSIRASVEFIRGFTGWSLGGHVDGILPPLGKSVPVESVRSQTVSASFVVFW